MSTTLERVTSEINALHDFISAWFRGNAPKDRQTYDAGFSKRLTEEFFNIQPSGKILSKRDLGDPIFTAHGSNPDFHIEIEDVEIRFQSSDGTLIVASYVEVQHGAKNTHPPTNARRSTVLFSFDKATENLVWLHVHETALPMDQRSS